MTVTTTFVQDCTWPFTLRSIQLERRHLKETSLNSRLKSGGHVDQARWAGISSVSTSDRIILNILTKISGGFIIDEKLTEQS